MKDMKFMKLRKTEIAGIRTLPGIYSRSVDCQSHQHFMTFMCFMVKRRWQLPSIGYQSLRKCLQFISVRIVIRRNPLEHVGSAVRTGNPMPLS